MDAPNDYRRSLSSQGSSLSGVSQYMNSLFLDNVVGALREVFCGSTRRKGRKDGQRWHPSWVSVLKHPAKQNIILAKEHQYHHCLKALDLINFAHFSHMEILRGSSSFLKASSKQCYCIVAIEQRIPGAWLLPEFIPIQDLQWLDAGLSIMANPMKFTAGGWCSLQV